MSNISHATIELFDRNADKSVAHTDEMIEKGTYLRGNLFVRLVLQRLAKNVLVHQVELG